MDFQELRNLLALKGIKGIGDVSLRILVTQCGSAEEVFRSASKELEKTTGLNPSILAALREQADFEKADKEIEFIEKNDIEAISFWDKKYPDKLKHCNDAPAILFTKGSVCFNRQKTLAIVGTRKATPYGKDVCDNVIAELAGHNVQIVSGLAYGIDIQAHQAALKNGLSTLAVLGHGLETIYPSAHRKTAKQMLENGGLVSEYRSGSPINPDNFPTRNRIIAGLADAVWVVEAAESGGALITAEFANGYNRDVFASPGRINDPYSRGCNSLIAQNKAILVQSAADIVKAMMWDLDDEQVQRKKSTQRKLFVDLDLAEQPIVGILEEYGEMLIDELSMKATIPVSKLSAILMQLELKGVLKALPGKKFQIA